MARSGSFRHASRVGHLLAHHREAVVAECEEYGCFSFGLPNNAWNPFESTYTYIHTSIHARAQTTNMPSLTTPQRWNNAKPPSLSAVQPLIQALLTHTLFAYHRAASSTKSLTSRPRCSHAWSSTSRPNTSLESSTRMNSARPIAFSGLPKGMPERLLALPHCSMV